MSFFSTSTSTGISFPYPHITLHAVSRASSIPTAAAATNGDSNGTESTTSNRPCLYCQLEESEQIDDSDDGTGTREMWIVPKQEENRACSPRPFADSSKLNTSLSSKTVEKIFSSLSYCASLHPPTSSGDASVLSESPSAEQSSQASLFASMGLDPSSMVYADENGQLAGPGLVLLEEEGAEGQWEDVAEGQEESSAGRQRSDFVNPGRRAPY